jgi:hypothetical protein
MSHVSFGHFSLIDGHGAGVGDVIIAPEYILLQRGREAGVHDLSYLAVWSAERTAALSGELAALDEVGSSILDANCPELRAILKAISPAATPVFLRVGQCSRAFARRRLRAALRTADAALTAAG